MVSAVALGHNNDSSIDVQANTDRTAVAVSGHHTSESAAMIGGKSDR
jgi:hypothetical protein